MILNSVKFSTVYLGRTEEKGVENFKVLDLHEGTSSATWLWLLISSICVNAHKGAML